MKPEVVSPKLMELFQFERRLRRRGVPGQSEYEAKVEELMSTEGEAEWDKHFRSLNERYWVIGQYGFAIPPEESISLLARCPQPMVEVGAGLAYWAMLLKERYGVGVDCYDIDVPPNTAPHESHSEDVRMRGYGFAREPWYPVMPGTPESIGRKDYRTLLLIWPDYKSKMASKCLQKFRGDVVVYVGEDQGCTADDAFHESLGKEWEAVFTVNHPQWFGMHDYMGVFVRKSFLEKVKLLQNNG